MTPGAGTRKARDQREPAVTVAALDPKLESTPPTNVPPELRDNLRQLGYIE